MRRLKNLFSIPHIKCFAFCFGLLFSIFSVIVLSSSSASATDLVGTGDMWIDSITYERGVYGSSGWGLYTPTSPSNTNDHMWTFSILGHSATTELTRLYIAYKTGPSRAALINFQISYYLSSTSMPITYNGLKFKNTTVMLSEQCFNSQGVAYNIGSAIEQDFTCNYLVYIPAGRKSIDTAAGTTILEGPTTGSGTVTLHIQPANFVELSNDHLSDNDKAWLEAHLPAGTSQADIEQAVEDAIDAAGIVAAQNATTNAVRAQTQQQHEDYESEVEREEAKQEELEEQADDLSLSASSTGNPFANMFNASGCVNMPIVGGWFGNPNLKVCSPYPATIANILNFVGSAVIVGFLIRIYYKHMNGGYQS